MILFKLNKYFKKPKTLNLKHKNSNLKNTQKKNSVIKTEVYQN